MVEYLPPELIPLRILLYTPSVTTTSRRIEKDVAKLRLDLTVLTDGASQLQQGNDYWWLSPNPADRTELLIVDEADRLKMASLEQLRDIYDRGRFGLVLIGMPGLEKRLARYPQLYSRVVFVHQFQALSTEEAHLILTQKWQQWGLTLQPNDFTDAEAVAAIIRITGGISG